MHIHSEGQIKCFDIETQCLPDTAASTLLRLHLGGIMKIFQHSDIDMRGTFIRHRHLLTLIKIISLALRL